MASGDNDPDRWWHGGVFYQIYPRSYADSNGDGVGDLPGVISKLDHLARLGITGVWLSPITCSPNRDWGYDVSDYCDVDPAYGTLDDLDTLGARQDGAASASSWTWCPTTPATSTRGSSTRRAGATWPTATTTCGPTPSPTGAHPTTG